MPFVTSTLICRLCSLASPHSLTRNIFVNHSTTSSSHLSLSPSPFLRLWGSYTSSPTICSYKRRLCRRRSTSRRWSRRSWAFTCPRSSPVSSNPFFFTVQTEEESLWLLCVCHLSSGRQPLSHFWWSSTRLKAYYSNTSYLQAPFHLQGDVGSLWDHKWTFWAEHFGAFFIFLLLNLCLFVCLPGLCIANMQCFCSLAPLSFSPLSFSRWDFCIFPVQQNELCSRFFPS